MDRREGIEAAVKACYATWSDSYFRDYCGEGAGYPPVHYEILGRLLAAAEARSVLDAGCGPASFLRGLAGSGLALYGFDLTEAMVAEGRRVFAGLGLPQDRLWPGSVLDAGSYVPPPTVAGPPGGAFDAAVCCGVFPHIAPESDAVVLGHLRDAVRPGGLVAVEARNALFSLFTLNRYSLEFFLGDLVRAETLLARLAPQERPAVEQALGTLAERFRMDQPPVRRGDEASPGYDEVLSRTHNPFVLGQLFEQTGLGQVRTHFYHYHCLPPLLAQAAGPAFVRESLAMEDPGDWRGHFMASAFIVTGVRP